MPMVVLSVSCGTWIPCGDGSPCAVWMALIENPGGLVAPTGVSDLFHGSPCCGICLERIMWDEDAVDPSK